jgi:hypothetical protein
MFVNQHLHNKNQIRTGSRSNRPWRPSIKHHITLLIPLRKFLALLKEE